MQPAASAAMRPDLLANVGSQTPHDELARVEEQLGAWRLRGMRLLEKKARLEYAIACHQGGA